MRRQLRCPATILALCCALLGFAFASPASAGAQDAAAKEYELGPLPRTDGQAGSRAAPKSSSITNGSADQGTEPALLVVLGGGAALCIGLGLRRMWGARER